jgi:hypothetical protein
MGDDELHAAPVLARQSDATIRGQIEMGDPIPCWYKERLAVRGEAHLPALVAGGAEVSEAEAQHKPQDSRPSFSPASLSQAIPRVRDVGVFISIDFAVSVLLDGTSMSSLKEANSSLEIGMIPEEFKNEPTCTT